MAIVLCMPNVGFGHIISLIALLFHTIQDGGRVTSQEYFVCYITLAHGFRVGWLCRGGGRGVLAGVVQGERGTGKGGRQGGAALTAQLADGDVTGYVCFTCKRTTVSRQAES